MLPWDWHDLQILQKGKKKKHVNYCNNGGLTHWTKIKTIIGKINKMSK